MASKKKTNYIGEELQWLEERCLELREWVQTKLSGGIQDRVEIFREGRTPIIKIISSEEQQIKCLRDTLREIPSMLMEINRLRKLADEEEIDGPSVRGDHEIPGFMDDDDEDSEETAPAPKSKSKKQEKEDSEKTSPKKLLPAPKEDAGFADDDDEDNDDKDDFDFDEGDFEDP